MLGNDETTIEIGGELARLRPTLRAAMRLAGRYGSFDAVIRSVVDRHLGVIADVVAESCDQWSNVPAVLKALDQHPLVVGVESLVGPLIRHVLLLAGVDPDSPDTATGDNGKRITFSEYHTKLFAIATGWLGWPPAVAWSSTASEIQEAYKGRVEMLSACFGGGSKEDADPTAPLHQSDADIAAGRAKLKALAATGGNRAV